MRIHWLEFTIAVGAVGCGGGRAEAQSAQDVSAPSVAPAPAEPKKEAPPSAAALGDVGGVGAPAEGTNGSTATPAGKKDPTRKPMLDIEARFRIESKDVGDSVRRLHALVERAGGYVVQESVSTDQYSPPQADLTLRVPATDARRFFDELGALGQLRGRNVESKDIGKEYFDAELRLQTLEQSRARYEELLTKATSVEDTVAVQARLEEVRERIESLKGEIRWLRDRAAQATVHVNFFSPESVVSPYEAPSATFYPGVRLSYARNLGGDYGTSDFFGPGLSIRLSRHFSVDIEGLPSTTSGYGGEDFDLFLATLGGELYSDFLGGGERTFFNPYLGLRAGYARFLRLDEIALGGVVGVEIVKTPIFTLDFETRSYVLFATSEQAHALIQPGLGLNVAF